VQLFCYADGWADLVIAQMAATRESPKAMFWGYACLCVGRHFDDVIEELYEELDRATGEYLHVFSMLPPPRAIVEKRLMQLRVIEPELPGPAAVMRERLTSLQSRTGQLYAYQGKGARRTQVGEKVRLLKELAEAGLKVDQYADFLFFDFHQRGDQVDVDVIAAKQSPVVEGASSYKYVDLFSQMGKKARSHYMRGDSVEVFVKDLGFDWAIHVALEKTFSLRIYLENLAKGLSR